MRARERGAAPREARRGARPSGTCARRRLDAAPDAALGATAGIALAARPRRCRCLWGLRACSAGGRAQHARTHARRQAGRRRHLPPLPAYVPQELGRAPELHKLGHVAQREVPHRERRARRRRAQHTEGSKKVGDLSCIPTCGLFLGCRPVAEPKPAMGTAALGWIQRPPPSPACANESYREPRETRRRSDGSATGWSHTLSERSDWGRSLTV